MANRTDKRKGQVREIEVQSKHGEKWSDFYAGQSKVSNAHPTVASIYLYLGRVSPFCYEVVVSLHQAGRKCHNFSKHRKQNNKMWNLQNLICLIFILPIGKLISNDNKCLATY